MTEIQRTLGGLKTAFAGLITTATIGAFIGATKRALDYAASLGEVAQQLGVTTRALSTYRYIATQAGVEQDAMDKSLAKLNRTIGEAAAGGKAQQEAFRELGIDIRGLTAESALPKLADAFAKINDPTTKARLAVDFFGKSGQQLIPLLNQGSAAIDEMRAEAEKLGIVLDDQLIAQADAAADALAKVQKTLEAGFARAVAGSANEIKIFADWLAIATKNAFDLFSGLVQVGRGLQTIQQTQGAWGVLTTPLGEAAKIGTPKGRAQETLRAGQQALTNFQAAEARYKKRPTPTTLSDMEGARAELRRLRDVQRQARADYNASNAPIPAAPLSGPASIKPSGGGGRPKKDRTEELAAKREEMRLEHELARAEAVGDQDAINALRVSLDLRKRIDEYRDAGLSKEAALETATREQSELAWDIVAANIRAVQLADQERALEEASARGDQEAVRVLQEKIARHERIAFWQDKGLSLTEAQGRATRDLLAMDEARAEAAEKATAQAEREHAIDLASIRGDSEESIRRQRQEANIEQMRADGATPEEIAQAQRHAMEINQAYVQGFWRDTLKSGVRAGLDGNLGQWFESWWKDGVANALDQVLNSFADKLGELLGGTGGNGAKGGSGLFDFLGKLVGGFSGVAGGGGAGPTAASTAGGHHFGGLPGLARGGSFMVGQRPGIDRNVLSVNGVDRALVSATERVTVGPGTARNDNNRPIVIAVHGEEGSVFAARVESLSEGVSVKSIGRAGAVVQRKGYYSLLPRGGR